MAIDAFLKITGIAGESYIEGHENEIDVLSWSWGMSNSSGTHERIRTSASASVNDITITKNVDKATPDLMMAVCNGDWFCEAKLVCRKAGGEKPLENLKILMMDVYVISLSTGGSDGELQMTEQITLNFGKVYVEYIEQLAEGGPGATPKMGWDMKKNTKI